MNIYFGGLGIRGNGYPNAARTIALLENANLYKIIQCGEWLPDELRLWKLAALPRWRAIGWIVKLAVGNLRSLMRVCIRLRREGGVVYIPYPAIFFLSGLRVMPRRWRPRVVVDSYISIWDSMFCDRAHGRLESNVSRCVKRLESMALRAASLVLVDTEASREMFIVEFGLERTAVRSLPLAIEEEVFLRVQSPRLAAGKIRVVFIGTLIPLHGIDTILGAFGMLADDERFDLRLIGDGQEATKVEAFLATGHARGRVTWVRDWHSTDQMASELALADICLGVFGGAGKAARVLPFKVYMYMAAGKAVITQSLYSLPEGCPALPVAHADSALALAEKIKALSDDSEATLKLATASRAYYAMWLSNARVLNTWKGILMQLRRT